MIFGKQHLKIRKQLKISSKKLSDNYTIIINKGGFHEDYLHDIFRALLSVTNTNFNPLIEISKDDLEIGT